MLHFAHCFNKHSYLTTKKVTLNFNTFSTDVPLHTLYLWNKYIPGMHQYGSAFYWTQTIVIFF